MKKFHILLLALAACLALAGCAKEHTWVDANCESPKTCSECGLTEGEPLGHTWQDATCENAKTCSVCAATEGEPLGHTWQDATCDAPETCTVCAATEGEALEHRLFAGAAEETSEGILYTGSCISCDAENLSVTYEDWEAFLEDHLTGTWEYSMVIIDGEIYDLDEEYQSSYYVKFEEDHTGTLSLGDDLLTGSWIYSKNLDNLCVLVFNSDKGLVYMGFGVSVDLLYVYIGDTSIVLGSADLIHNSSN